MAKRSHRKKRPDPSETGLVGPTSGDKTGKPVESNPPIPAPESVIGETGFTSPSGKKYRIIHTTETDPKDGKK